MSPDELRNELEEKRKVPSVRTPLDMSARANSSHIIAGQIDPPTQRAAPARNPEHVDRFFDRFYAPLNQLAQEMGISPELLIGLAVAEYGWQGTHLNNMFGLTSRPNELRNFAAPEDSIAAFRQTQWFKRLRDIHDVDALVAAMRQSPMYNNEDGYYEKLRNVMETVRHRLPMWHAK